MVASPAATLALAASASCLSALVGFFLGQRDNLSLAQQSSREDLKILDGDARPLGGVEKPDYPEGDDDDANLAADDVYSASAQTDRESAEKIIGTIGKSLFVAWLFAELIWFGTGRLFQAWCRKPRVLAKAGTDGSDGSHFAAKSGRDGADSAETITSAPANDAAVSSHARNVRLLRSNSPLQQRRRSSAPPAPGRRNGREAVSMDEPFISDAGGGAEGYTDIAKSAALSRFGDNKEWHPSLDDGQDPHVAGTSASHQKDNEDDKPVDGAEEDDIELREKNEQTEENDSELVAELGMLVKERWVADDPGTFAIFEEQEEERTYHRKRSFLLARFVRAFLALQEAGETLLEDLERVQCENHQLVGDVAYWKALVLEADSIQS
eukprot:TRINITY_DN68489_c0_g1_i1.p1 TRINITY_DN68489_c0_g1~~TRINITY_DN68489_c0_g1_i1.p1  ORF type:complete len:413 (-),score=70.56 TRINITY_DN68489_c0_g1_i1:122-1264(-)